MTGKRAFWLIVVLALICAAGIVGMLLTDSGWAWLFLVMAALPLLVGAWRWHAQRRQSLRKSRALSGE